MYRDKELADQVARAQQAQTELIARWNRNSPIFRITTDFDAIPRGYHLGIPILNRGIVPVGPDDLFLR